MRWGKVRRINNYRDPSSRSNFAPRRISKGNDWRNTLRCSINWRITFLSGQCHLHTTGSFCMCTLSGSFRYAEPNRRREEEEKDKRRGRRGKGDDEKREKRKGCQAREWERNDTSRLKYRVHVRSEHRDVGTSPVETFIRPSRWTNNIRKFVHKVCSRYHDQRMVSRLTQRLPSLRQYVDRWQWPRAKIISTTVSLAFGAWKTSALRCIADNDFADCALSRK